MKTLAILGGTFDPIHNGHLGSALELKATLGLDELRLLPCHLPPHRETPGTDSRDRLAMVRLAAAGTGLGVDDRELHRQGPSYSADTLRDIRAELGEAVSLSWVMGSDAFASFCSWHQWRDCLALAHLIVMQRPGDPLPDADTAEGDLLRAHQLATGQALSESSAGGIWPLALTPYPISATAIRAALARGEQPEGLPTGVLHYIQEHQLYGAAAGS